MLINLSGILRDGTGAALPAVQNVVIPQGVDCNFVCTILGQNATAINITGFTATMTLKIAQSPTSAAIPLVGVLTTPASGVCTFTLPAIQSKALPQPCYFYDVVISGGGSKDEVVPTGTITFSYAVGT